MWSAFRNCSRCSMASTSWCSRTGRSSRSAGVIATSWIGCWAGAVSSRFREIVVQHRPETAAFHFGKSGPLEFANDAVGRNAFFDCGPVIFEQLAEFGAVGAKASDDRQSGVHVSAEERGDGFGLRTADFEDQHAPTRF